jgi:hypothetical protein
MMQLNQVRSKRVSCNIWQVTVFDKCKAVGAGIEKGFCNIVQVFVIEARNAKDNIVKHGGDRFEVTVTSPSKSVVPCQIADNRNGTYKGISILHS